MFFNERFEFVEEGSMVKRVSQPGDGAASLVLPNIKAPKNGYAYIYLSNENDDAVYFDNFTISYTRGKIIEENHYYAFGLRIAGISSRKFDGGIEGDLVNHYLYNDKELFEDAGLDWYDYGFRNYDPQIARFTQLDPLTWDYPELTNYQYASNEPIANVDMDGLEKYLALDPVVINATIKSGKVVIAPSKIALITARGVSDALTNANTFGLSDALGNNHLDSYESRDEKIAYLRGRLGGDAIAAAQGGTEVDAGAGVALSTGVQSLGVGAGVGLVVGLHGAGVGATAAYDVAWALKELYKLNASASGSLDGGTSPQKKKFEPLANTKAGKEAIEQSKLPKGFKKTNEFGKQHGQDVYKKGNRYYSKDIDEHNITGGWKVFKKVGNRLVRIGTADKDLKIFKK